MKEFDFRNNFGLISNSLVEESKKNLKEFV